MSAGVIVAAGSGTRMGPGVEKLEREVRGKPLLLYSLHAFQSAETIEYIVLVVRGDAVARWSPSKCSGRGIDKVKSTVEGAGSRQGSVLAALKEIPSGERVVAIHDGARPLVKAGFIDEIVGELKGCDGVVPALPLTDTVKEVADRGWVTRTPNRDNLMAVQTPQAFLLEVLRKAHLLAMEKGWDATDDASLVERMGGRIKVVPGDRTNIKVTYPDDLEVMGAILRDE